MARRRALACVLAAALLAALSACGGDDEDDGGQPGPAAVTSTAVDTTDVTVTDSTAVTETSAAPDTTGAGTTVADGEAVSPDVVTAAAGKTAGLGTARLATSVTLSGDGIPEQTFGGAGVVDLGSGRGKVDVDLSGLEGSAYTKATVIFDDYVAYYGLPPGFLPGSYRWLRLDPGSLAESANLDLGSLFQGSQADPTQYLHWLEAIGPDVRKTGEEEIRGVPTTRYNAAVELARLAAQAPAGHEDAWAAYVDSLYVVLGGDRVPVTIWVDGDGVVRRMRQESTIGPEGMRTTTATTLELWDFGAPEVRVKLPPKKKVANVTDFVRP